MSARNMIGRASLPREGSAEVTVANVGLRPGLFAIGTSAPGRSDVRRIDQRADLAGVFDCVGIVDGHGEAGAAIDTER